MHIPKQFQQHDQNQLKQLIREFPFATLVAQTSDGLDASHLPLVWAQKNDVDVLQGHIARVNPLWKIMTPGSEALLIFNGPNCYVSPNYYPTKTEHGRAVPTWNYLVVHVRGLIRFVHDATWNLAMLDALTRQHERLQAKPWSTADAPPKYLQGMLRGIVGIEIEITSMHGQWKVSQNQPAVNQDGVINGLNAESNSASVAIAAEVRRFMQTESE